MPLVKTGNVEEVSVFLQVREEEMKTRRDLASLKESGSSN